MFWLGESQLRWPDRVIREESGAERPAAPTSKAPSAGAATGTTYSPSDHQAHNRLSSIRPIGTSANPGSSEKFRDEGNVEEF